MLERTLRVLVFLVAMPFLSTGLWAAQEPPRISASAARQMDVLRGIKTSKGAVQEKIDSRLFLGLLHRRGDQRLAPLTDFRFVVPEGDGRVPVDVAVTSTAGVKPVVNKLASLGSEVQAMSYAYRRVSARVRLEDLEALAAMPEVRKVRQRMPALAQAINVSEGDKTHGAEHFRSFFGVTGVGVKICVISTGVDSLASLVASGDLPAGIDVIPGGSGDEGSGMLEIVHDLAPGAALGFAPGFIDEATFAQNILALAASPHNCNVIVDDALYLDESPFEDGPVAQAVNTVTAAGVLYFSAAGNEGNADDLTSGTWEGDFLASSATDPPLLPTANLHDFGDGGNSILVEFGGGNPPLLTWAEHYDLASATASTDFDLYDMDGALTTLFDASMDRQDGMGGDDFPIEFIGGGTFSGERLLIDKFAAGTTSSVPMLNLIVFRGELDDNLATGGATRGHGAAAAAFSVAATPAAASFDGIAPDGPYPDLFNSANETESFSSDGPRRILLSPAGAELTPGNRTSTGGVVRQKPDVTAADGVSTAVPGANPFYGTSAAAAHAAAIAGLFKSVFPSSTPAQIRSLLIESAIDVEAPGADRDTGAGIVMAELQEGMPQGLLTAGTAVPTQLIGDGDAFIESNETWALTIPLTNVGGASVTALSAVLTTSTPGVTIGFPNSTYPGLAPNASGNNASPYVFTVTGGLPCGGSIQLILTVTYTGGSKSPQTFNFSLKTGSPGAPVTVSYTGPAVAIPDGADLSGAMPGAPVSANLNVAVIPGNVFDVDLRIDGTACSATAGSTTVGIDHSFVNDLELTLIAPNGAQVKVIDNTDGSGNNFCQTLLDDDGGDPPIQGVATANAPFTGSFTPASALSAFDGTAANGNWQLQAQDFFSQDTGNIRSWSLTITPVVCDAPVPAVNVTATKTVSGQRFPGGTITYTVVLTNSGNGLQADNPGNEFTDTLPASLTVGAVSASSGMVSASGVNPVTWNGSIPPGGSVTVTIQAIVNQNATSAISNQGTVSYDSNGDGVNDTGGVTDDPATSAPEDPTTFFPIIADPFGIPTLSGLGLTVLVLTLAGAALLLLRRRRKTTLPS